MTIVITSYSIHYTKLYDTDLSLEQMIRLATAANSIDSDNIHNDVLDYDYVSSYP